MKWADVIMVSNISNYGGQYTARVVGKAREFGKFVQIDNDDLLTDLYEEHRLAETYKEKKLGEITKFMYSNAHLVTVTQIKFADRIKPFCGNVLAVIKNAIDYDLPCWNEPVKKNKQVRIGWAAGIHHDPDVKIISKVPALVNQKVGRENVWWDFYGRPPVDAETGEDWQHEVWDGYKRELLRGFKGARNWTIWNAMPPDAYGGMYANMDIAIAPLKMNEFNDSKSDIKVAEAGRYKVPLIASNVGCYEDVIKNGETGYLVNPGSSVMSWVKILTKIIKDKKHRLEMGNNLHKITEEFYDINKVVGNRLDVYEESFKLLNFDPRDNRDD